jgi:hypothetical protein
VYRAGGYRSFAHVVSQFGAWAIGMALILVLGGWFMPWFSADEPVDPTSLVAPDGTIRVKLIETEICHTTTRTCGEMQSAELNHGWVGDLPYAIAVGGLLFAVLVLRADRRRQTHGEIGWNAIRLIAAAGVLTIAMIVVYLVKFDPGPIVYEIVEHGLYSFSPHGPPVDGVTSEPTIASGAFVTLVGIGLGCVAAWRARPIADDVIDEPVAEAPKPSEPRRAPIEAPPRGVGGARPETDPFRVLPEPPPIRVVQNVRPVETPRSASTSDTPSDGPKLLT